MMPRFGFATCACVAAVLLVTLGHAQSSNIPQFELRVTASRAVQGIPGAPVMFPLRCDADGNVYVRFYSPAIALQAPIIRISADGEGTKGFSIESVPALQDSDVVINGFAVSPRGAVMLAAWGWSSDKKTLKGYIIRFSSDGTLDSTIDLGSLSPDQAAEFGNGNLLVSGVKSVRLYGKDEPNVFVPTTEILDDSGRVLKEITLPGDVKPLKLSDPKFQKEFGVEPREISLGNAVTGVDGNIYLMRNEAKPKVYVISSDGALVRTLQLNPPGPNARASTTLQYRPDSGELVLSFQVNGLGRDGKAKVGKQIISAYSADTGERLYDYVVPPGVGQALACSSTKGFTFVGANQQHQLALREATPE